MKLTRLLQLVELQLDTNKPVKWTTCDKSVAFLASGGARLN